MNDANAVPWVGFVIMAVTMAVLYGLYKLVMLFAEGIIEAREALRDRYSDNRWRPHAIDLLGVPIWLVVEVIWLIGALLVGVILVTTAYSAASDFRDWWHEGGRGR